MKRFIALALLALSLTSTVDAASALYEDKGTLAAETGPDHGFMPGIIHDRAPRPDIDHTIYWTGQEERAAEPESFVWWTELEHLIGRFRP